LAFEFLLPYTPPHLLSANFGVASVVKMSKACIKTKMKKILLIIAAIIFLNAPALWCEDASLVMLVNQERRLANDFVPDLVKVGRSDVLLSPDVAEAYVTMRKALQEAAGAHNLRLISGYRSFAHQEEIFFARVEYHMFQGLSPADAFEKTAKYIALPGTSEHQTGLAVDVSDESIGNKIALSFADTFSGRWLAENSWRYGFILRYPKDKKEITRINFEPWHFRYVGIAPARIMRENNWSLEEYYDKICLYDNISGD